MNYLKDDSLKFVYENIRNEDKLYTSYEEFIKDIHKKEEKALKQLYIIKECIDCAQSIIQEFRDKVEKEIEDNPGIINGLP